MGVAGLSSAAMRMRRSRRRRRRILPFLVTEMLWNFLLHPEVINLPLLGTTLTVLILRLLGERETTRICPQVLVI
jgi:hypothetical protein